MTNSIIPPPELVQQWADMIATHTDTEVFSAAAQWGADQELEACIKWVSIQLNCTDQEYLVPHFRAARRPKPPSVKEQLLQKLEHIRDVAGKYQITQNAINDLRVALEALPND
jgi:hypothetical protein